MAAAPSITSPTIRYTHVVDHVITTSGNGQDDCTGWLLHWPVDLIGSHAVWLVTMLWDPGEQLIMHWLYSCICCQVNIFGRIRLQQINEASMVCSVRSALRCGNSLDVSLFYKHDHTQLDSKGTQFDFREQINGSVEQADNRSYHLDNLYRLSMQHVSISVAVNRDEKFIKGISFSVEKGQFKCPRMLHYHVSAACTVAHEGIYSWLIVNTRSELDLRYKGEYTSAIIDKEIMCSSCTLQAYSARNVEVPMVSNQLCSLIIFSLTIPWDLGPWRQIARQASRPSFWTELQKLNPIGVQIAMVLHLILLQQNLGKWCKPNMIFPTCSSSYSIGMAATCWVFVHLASGRYGGFSPRSTLAQSKRRHYFCSLTSILSTFTQTFASGDISCAENFPPHSMIPLIVHATNSSTETKIPDWSAAWATCENFLARASPDFVAFFDGSRGDLVMFSISLPWDPGVCNELNTEKLRSWFAEQQSGEALITASSYDSFACHMGTWAARWDCRGKCDRAQQQQYGALMHELIPQIACKTSPGEYAPFRSLEHQGELINELNDPWECLPQVHPVNDQRSGSYHGDQVGCMVSVRCTMPCALGMQTTLPQRAVAHHLLMRSDNSVAFLIDRLEGKPAFKGEGVSRTGLQRGPRWTLDRPNGPRLAMRSATKGMRRDLQRKNRTDV